MLDSYSTRREFLSSQQVYQSRSGEILMMIMMMMMILVLSREKNEEDIMVEENMRAMNSKIWKIIGEKSK